MARLRDLMDDPHAPSEIAMRVAEGDDLREIAKAWQVPKGKFIEWFTETYPEKYDAARKALGMSLVHAVQQMVDTATPETAALVKMRTDRYLRVAALLNPERYSPKIEHKHSGGPPVFNVFAVVQQQAPREKEITVLPSSDTGDL
jgi:hypothetical protein